MNTKTFTPCLKKKNKNDKSGIINIRITENRKSKYISLKISISETDWNKNKCEVKNKHPRSEEINNIIDNQLKELKSSLKGNDIEQIKNSKKESFIRYFNEYIQLLFDRVKIGTARNNGITLKHLKEYISTMNKSDLLFSDITKTFVRDFETYLLNKKIAPNTTKKYVSVFGRVYKNAIKMEAFNATTDPFILFDNKRMPVEKRKLEKRDIEKIIHTEIDRSNSLFKIKNLFLFQIFAQGLRVGDLFTLKWKNLIEGNIRFVQLKTKKPHTIYLNERNLLILKEFIPDQCDSVMNVCYEIKVDKKVYSLNYNDSIVEYKRITKPLLSCFMAGDKEAIEIVEKWKKILDDIKLKTFSKLLISISQYAKKNSNKFIFGVLNEEDFNGVLFNSETSINNEQYKKIESASAIYNSKLKDLQKLCDIDVKITSHLARHSYTNLLIEETDSDIYSISKLIGHSRLSATESYINELNTNRILNVSEDISNLFT